VTVLEKESVMAISNSKDELEYRTEEEGNVHPILYAENWELFKSSFVKGRQCAKYLFLDKFNRNKRTPPSEETVLAFEKGHRFENMFRDEKFPGGINVKDKVGIIAHCKSYTDYLLKKDDTSIIYEATFMVSDVLIMCDVLVKNDSGMIDIYECKSALAINDAIKNDLAIQYAICKKRFGDKLKSFNLVLATEDEGWTITDMKSELKNKVEDTNRLIDEFKNVLSSSEPNISMGSHCETPYRCEFIEYYVKQQKM